MRKSIKLIFVLMALTLFLTPAWGSVSDTKDTKDQDLSFSRNHKVAGTCVWVEFFEHRPVLARGGGSGGGSSYSHGGFSGGFGNNNGSHGNAIIRPNTEQKNQHQNEHQYQHQNELQYQHQKTTEKQNQHQHQYKYQHREESGAQN